MKENRCHRSTNYQNGCKYTSKITLFDVIKPNVIVVNAVLMWKNFRRWLTDCPVMLEDTDREDSVQAVQVQSRCSNQACISHSYFRRRYPDSSTKPPASLNDGVQWQDNKTSVQSANKTIVAFSGEEHLTQLKQRKIMTAVVWTTHSAFASFRVAVSRQTVTATWNTFAKFRASTLSVVTRCTILQRSQYTV